MSGSNETARPEGDPGGAAASSHRSAFAAAPDTLIRTCPVCGKALAERKCKLFCPDPICSYFLSCADYY
jgi:hypothetical protein